MNTKYFDKFVNVALDKTITLGAVTRKVSAVFAIKSINDLGKWHELILEGQVHSDTKKYRNDSKTVSYDGWYGTETIKDWIQIIKRGDKAVMGAIRKEKEKASKEFETLTSSTSIYDTDGLFFDIGKVVAGEPECWIKPSPEKEPDEITIRITTLAGHKTSPDDIIKGAGRILGMVDKLEKDGYKVKLENWLYTASAEGKRSKTTKDLLTIMTVKDFNESINYAKMSAMVSPSLQRRGMFMLREILMRKSLRDSYGSAGVFNYDEITQLFDTRQMDTLKEKLFEIKG